MVVQKNGGKLESEWRLVRELLVVAYLVSKHSRTVTRRRTREVQRERGGFPRRTLTRVPRAFLRTKGSPYLESNVTGDSAFPPSSLFHPFVLHFSLFPPYVLTLYARVPYFAASIQGPNIARRTSRWRAQHRETSLSFVRRARERKEFLMVDDLKRRERERESKMWISWISYLRVSYEKCRDLKN